MMTVGIKGGNMAEVNHRCAVLGKPIAHSLSPVLHNAAYQALGLDDWSYDKHEVGEPDLEGFLESLDPTWAGLSLTMPLKKTIQPYGTPCNMWAKELMIANTAVFDWNETCVNGNPNLPAIKLYNTDVQGIELAFEHSYQTRDGAEDGPFGNGCDHRQRQHGDVSVGRVRGIPRNRTRHRRSSPSRKEHRSQASCRTIFAVGATDNHCRNGSCY